MNVRLREFHPADANIIAGWLKSEYLMRQWCADRYSRYPVTAEDMNMYYRKFIELTIRQWLLQWFPMKRLLDM